MIIDTNCHLGHWPFRKLEHADAEGLLRLMDAHGVAQAWVGAFEGLLYRDCGQANRDLLAGIAGHEDRLAPWATINPNFPGWQDDLREAAGAGMQGVRLYPNYHGYELASPCVLELMARLRELRLPVAITHKFVDERLHHWRCLVPAVEMSVAPLVRDFPEVPLLLCGCGTLHAEALKETIRAGRVFMEISRLEGVEGVRWLADIIGWDRIVMGSHAPYFTMAAAHLKIVESGLTEEEREAVLYKNAAGMIA